MPQHRIGIIGVGAIAEVIARAIAEIPNATVVAGSCRTREKGEKFSSNFGCRWFASTEEMLDAAKPDVAVICTPSGMHLEPAIACAQRGVNVLCEKPLEITTARVRQMIDACQRSSIVLGGI